MSDPRRNGSGEELVAAFSRWAADQRVGAAAASRARERALREQARGDVTWTGVLVDLAEGRHNVTFAVGAQLRTGLVVGVGRAFVVLDQVNGRPALIRSDAIAAAWPEVHDRAGSAPAGPATGDRLPAIELDLASALSLLAEDRAPVTFSVGEGHEVSGDLVAVGADVLSVRTSPPARRSIHLPLSAVVVCELR